MGLGVLLKISREDSRWFLLFLFTIPEGFLHVCVFLVTNPLLTHTHVNMLPLARCKGACFHLPHLELGGVLCLFCSTPSLTLG